MQKIEVFWRDIPAQVLVKRGRVRGKAASESPFSGGYRSRRYARRYAVAAMSISRTGAGFTSAHRQEQGSPQELAQQFADA